MAFNVVLTAGFKKELKHIAKKHRQILSDITALIEELSQTPQIGADLGKNVYKIRVAITGTSKGKSGGARVITYVKIIAHTVILTEIYLKSQYDTVDVDAVIERLGSEGYI
ncbi:type II toxin-antitoxin system RelE/ParE family toxin [Mucilaginibacter sp.]|uniref:type II toxin-antitoxin system RelE/ParE family toxin n=1 Tax=Mucilaginibacter sp. TaxID=1882438 RepID=UPI002843B1D9|nr:type II toxin-antitoxin system RelE/ParE family toxin [Mucilaginibacter sp.]MDR3697690.1 type II toxin-antitoxin system RelE/ParE family toxin [Mucilaginibacter sp.]